MLFNPGSRLFEGMTWESQKGLAGGIALRHSYRSDIKLNRWIKTMSELTPAHSFRYNKPDANWTPANNSSFILRLYLASGLVSVV